MKINSPRLEELKKQRRKVFLNKFILIFLGCLVLFIGFGYISRLDRLNISKVEVVGNKIVDTETIKEVLDTTLAGYYFKFFPKTNIFFYPKSKIKENLASNFSRLENIDLEVGEDRILKISVSERGASYTWCGAIFEPAGEKNSQCYFLDKDGYIFDQSPYFSGEVYFKFYGGLELEGNTPVGSYFAKDIFTKLVSFIETLEKMGLHPAISFVESNDDIKIFLSKNSEALMGPEIIFNKSSDFQKVAENLSAALDTEPFKTDFRKKYSSLLYIDLRFGNKVHYKFR